MSDVEALSARKRRWWLALLLNVFLPPAGYAYVGRWRYAWIFVGAVLLVGVLLLQWSFAHPPGLFEYAQSRAPTVIEQILGWSVPALVGAHGAWLAGRSPPKQGARVLHGLTYLGPLVLLLFGAIGLRALWPQSSYSMASSSMEPTLHAGDVLAVRGAPAFCGHAHPVPGDVVIDRPRGSRTPYVQRIVAGPGQTLAMKGGQLWVDGKAVVQLAVGQAAGGQGQIVRETLANGRTYETLDRGPTSELDNIGPLKIPADHWYALGDSRDNAADSRVYGPVASHNLCAVVERILDSKDKSRVGRQP